MTTRYKFDKTVKRDIINNYRNFASAELQSTNTQDHIDFSHTIINGKRQNADKFFSHLKNAMVLPTWITKDTVRNLLRRAVSKGSTTDSSSPEAIKMFSDWALAQKSNLRTSSIQDIARRSSYVDVRPVVVTTVKQSGVMHAATKVKSSTPVKVRTPKVVKVPTTTAEIIEYAITNTTFTATELLTKKFTIVEFLERIKIKVQL